MEKIRRFGVTKEDATKRAIEDYSQYAQHLRSVFQYVIAANGGAAAAMLSFMTALATSARSDAIANQGKLVKYLAGAAGCYLCGIMLAVVALYLFSQSKQSWGHFWESAANSPGDENYVKPDFGGVFAADAARLDDSAGKVLAASAFAFIPGSIIAIIGFLITL